MSDWLMPNPPDIADTFSLIKKENTLFEVTKNIEKDTVIIEEHLNSIKNNKNGIII